MLMESRKGPINTSNKQSTTVRADTSCSQHPLRVLQTEDIQDFLNVVKTAGKGYFYFIQEPKQLHFEVQLSRTLYGRGSPAYSSSKVGYKDLGDVGYIIADIRTVTYSVLRQSM